MSDITLNIHEAKTHLSRHLKRLKHGDRIVLCNRNRPVAEVRLLPQKKKPRIGVAKGEFVVPPEFMEPLDPDILDAFEGGP